MARGISSPGHPRGTVPRSVFSRPPGTGRCALARRAVRPLPRPAVTRCPLCRARGAGPGLPVVRPSTDLQDQRDQQIHQQTGDFRGPPPAQRPAASAAPATGLTQIPRIRAGSTGTARPDQLLGGVREQVRRNPRAPAPQRARRPRGACSPCCKFPATPAGYARLLGWLGGFGTVCLVGIEGTGSYGAGLSRHVTAAGIRVVEVDRSDRQDRRRPGKSRPPRCGQRRPGRPIWPGPRRAQGPGRRRPGRSAR